VVTVAFSRAKKKKLKVHAIHIENRRCASQIKLPWATIIFILD
jgi:hypothetical protein